jgi:arsenate reductase (glutaredoxin)
MERFFYLSTCSTCIKIIKQINLKNITLQDIKKESVTEEQLDEMKKISGSYESLFSKRAINYTKLGLKNKQLQESDYKKYILSDYTFLKRPVLIYNNKIVVGNSPKEVSQYISILND